MPTTSPIYLDYGAATPMDPAVVKIMEPYFTRDFYNPSATYLAARHVRGELRNARQQVAGCLGSQTSEIVFTAGGSEANNLAIHGIMSLHPKANLVISSIEHESVLAPAKQYPHQLASVQPDGRIDLDDLRAKINEQTVLVSIMYANNEIGSVQPIREVAQLVADIRKKRGLQGLPLYLHTDACQAANYLDLHVARLGVDLMTLNGGKIYGPKQSGVLFMKAGLQLHPLIAGGGQEYGLRSGTENVAAIMGFSKALSLVQADHHEEAHRLRTLQQHFFHGLAKAVPAAVINGSRKHRLPNNIHFTLPGSDNERLLMELDEAGIQAAAGSACSASNETPSHVLRAIGLDDEEARASLRLTMGRQTTIDQLDRVLDTLSKLC